MRATILPKAIILTKAHRAAVSIMAMGSVVPLRCSYLYYPTMTIF